MVHFAKGLRRSFVAVIVSLALALAGSAAWAIAQASDRSQSTGGSTLGIHVEGALPESGVDVQGNDSNLGIRVASAASEDVAVEFWSQGKRYYVGTISYGSYAIAPAVDPIWDWGLYDGEHPAPGLIEGVSDEPLFDAWCVDEHGKEAFDFSRPVTESPLILYSGWNIGKRVKVTLDALGGTMEDPGATPGTDVTVETLTIVRFVDSSYRELPVPEMPGYTFDGWWTRDGREDGEWGVEAQVATRVGDISDTDHTLYARWKANVYYVNYINNDDGKGGGSSHEVAVTYGGSNGARSAFLGWTDVTAHGFKERHGYRFDGWNDRADGAGNWYAANSVIDPDLTDVPGAHVSLYVQWAKDGTVEEGPFDVRFVYGDGMTPDAVVSIAKGEKVPEPDAPKWAGYQFSGWYSDALFVNKWSFESQVKADMTLYAKWDLRLDVTVPVSIDFVVNADTKEVITPNIEAYAVKSRTVRPVTIDALEAASMQDELDALFELDDGAIGWHEALRDTMISMRSERAKQPIGISFANNESVGPSWVNECKLSAQQKADYRLDAFDYAAQTFDENWQGGDPSERLALKFDMAISEELDVRVGQAGALPITHLKMTVSTRQ